MIYVGVDPGKRGGYASIYDDCVETFPWDDVFFISQMKSLLATGESIVACVEKVGAFKGQGVTSMFNFGKSAGYIEGVLSALGIPYQLVPPQVWKREFSLIGKDKKASIEVCKRLFPGLNLLPTSRSKVPSDGCAEAALICMYAKRHY